MEALITGSSSGIGLCTAQLFIERGSTVCGIDIAPPAFSAPGYRHFTADVADRKALEALKLNPDVVLTCAGAQSITTSKSTKRTADIHS